MRVHERISVLACVTWDIIGCVADAVFISINARVVGPPVPTSGISIIPGVVFADIICVSGVVQVIMIYHIVRGCAHHDDAVVVFGYGVISDGIVVRCMG